MTTALPELVITAPELRGGNLALGACRDTEVLLDGPAGCIAGETRIYNPLTGQHTSVKDLCEKGIAPIVQTLMGAIQAEVPFRKGVRDLYRVTLASGRQVVTTDNHLFLTPDGWRFLSACAPGSQFLISAPCPHPTTEGLDLLVSWRDALCLSQKPPGSQGRYSAYSRRCDELLQMARETVLVPSLPLTDAHEHTHAGLCEDDQDASQGYSRRHRQSDRHARRCYAPLSDDRADTQLRDRSGISLQSGVLCRHAAQSQKEKRPLLPTAQPLLDADSTRRRAPSLVARLLSLLPQRLFGEASPVHQQLWSYSVFSDTTQQSADAVLSLDAYSPSIGTSNHSLHADNTYYTAQWDTVSNIEYVRTDEYFDLHVPIVEHYLAEGIWHHNTGKTYAALYKIHVILTNYPHSKALVVRELHSDLAGSAMATFQDNVLDPREGVYYFGGNKVKPAGYIYPNGSFLAVNGLDKPTKVKSFECDIAYINEASECSVEDIEFVRMRLRKGNNPFQQIIMDTNPDAPTHWLNQRCNDGVTTPFSSPA